MRVEGQAANGGAAGALRRSASVDTGALIILVGGAAMLALAAAPMLWRRDDSTSYGRKQARNGSLFILLFIALAVAYRIAEAPEPSDPHLQVFDVAE